MVHVLAVDLGASSGRLVLGSWDPDLEKLELREIHRFPNEPVEVRGTLHWDILRLYHEILKGIRKAAHSLPPGQSLASVGIDTWGVDFGLLDAQGRLLANPVHYRDHRTDGQVELQSQRLGEGVLFRKTGIQDAWFNTVNQLRGALDRDPHFLDGARSLLFTPDLLGYFLTGRQGAERTIASTSQLLAAGRPHWCLELFEALDLPVALMQPVAEPGTVLGPVSEELAAELEVPGLVVTLVPGHDTESAALAVPSVSGKPFAFLSCGTWSVLGAELLAPVLTEDARKEGFSNEAGADQTTLLLRNITGLWTLQECKRWWERDGAVLDHGDLVSWARQAPAWGCAINVNDPRFAGTGDLARQVQDYCRETGQRVPQTQGEIVRTILESLAFEYRRSLEALERVTGQTFEEFWIVGGGTKNRLLCEITAAVLDRPVLIGPEETTALGNLVCQFLTAGVFRGRSEARKAAAAFGSLTIRSEGISESAAAYGRWLGLPDVRG